MFFEYMYYQNQPKLAEERERAYRCSLLSAQPDDRKTNVEESPELTRHTRESQAQRATRHTHAMGHNQNA